jgi:chromosome segregation ATPase
LDILRKEKDDYALFKSNEGHIEENEKVILAHEFFENNIFLKDSAQKVRDNAESQLRLKQELAIKLEELEVIKRTIQKITLDNQSNEKENLLKDEIRRVENEVISLTQDITKLNRDQQDFTKTVKKAMVKEAERAEMEAGKLAREIEEASREAIPQSERELEERKEQRRNVDKELKALKDGKDNSQNQIDAIAKEI